MKMEELTGGRGGILRAGGSVHRPAGTWTRQVHRLLEHVRHNGFMGAPQPLGFDEQGREIVSHIAGEVSNYPLSASAVSPEALTSAATLLRRYHDATVDFLVLPGALDSWQLPPRPPFEVVCHGDFAPYNVVLDGKRAVGIIDFDTAHPAPRVWDIAYALYRWAPLTNPKNHDGFGDLTTQTARAVAFCDAYGLEASARRGLITLVADRLQVLVDFMLAEARAGNAAFEANLSDGHHLLYIADIAYIRDSAERVERALLREQWPWLNRFCSSRMLFRAGRSGATASALPLAKPSSPAIGPAAGPPQSRRLAVNLRSFRALRTVR